VFKFITILASVVSVAAFAPASRVASSSALKMGFETEAGVTNPVGFWDPCGLSNSIDQDTFDQYRTAELKHGRVSQVTPSIKRKVWCGVVWCGVVWCGVVRGDGWCGVEWSAVKWREQERSEDEEDRRGI
jgi:hypothetical protein